jgi:hypothetical protein
VRRTRSPVFGVLQIAAAREAALPLPPVSRGGCADLLPQDVRAKPSPAARRWLVRYLTEGTPGLQDVAKVSASLAELEA